MTSQGRNALAVAAKRVVAVSAPDKASPMVLELARDVGRVIMARGFHLLVGGLTPVLAACCSGAQAEKNNLRRRGKLVGDAPCVLAMLPGIERPEGGVDVDVVIPTGLGAAVHSVVCASCDALIALEGGAGTLSQAALGWTLGKPLVLLTPNGSVLDHLVGERLDVARQDIIMAAENAERALDILMPRLRQE